MSVIPKGIYLLILGRVKERRKLTCGNSLLQVETLTSRSGIATLFIDTGAIFNMA